MSDQGNWGPPPGGGPPGHDPGRADEDQRDSSEDLTVPRTMAMDADQLRAAGISMPGEASAPPSGFGQPPAGPAAPASAGAPVAAPAGEKKSKKGLILAGCGGCLFILLSICCCSGYIFYLEEGVSYSDPGDELESFPIAQGQPFEARTTWEGTGYAHIRAYVDLGEDAPSTTRVTGQFGCRDYGTLELAPVSETAMHLGDLPAGWVELPRTFLYVRDGESVECTGQLSADPPVSSMRLVITERQRPSDWLSGF